ncbi:hypothetical protein HDV06_005798 [Boothiomyces sp. JEL0866]|nr:hypothetical protein HDV06_005798 [Boothiomyces sp. JEL0866]
MDGFDKKQLIEMEGKILIGKDYLLQVPTPITFLECFLEELAYDLKLNFDTSANLLILLQKDVYFMKYGYSIQAAACLLVSLLVHDTETDSLLRLLNKQNLDLYLVDSCLNQLKRFLSKPLPYVCIYH